MKRFFFEFGLVIRFFNELIRVSYVFIVPSIVPTVFLTIFDGIEKSHQCRKHQWDQCLKMVGDRGLEPPTSSMSTKRSSQLS